MEPEKETVTEQKPVEARPILGVDTSGQGLKAPKFKHFSRPTRLIALVMIIAAIAAGAFLLVQKLGLTKNYVFKVNGKTYNQSEADVYIKPIMEATEKSQSEATQLLYDTLITIELAKLLDESPSQELIDAEFNKIPGVLSQSQEIQAWLKLASTKLVIDKKFNEFRLSGTVFSGYSYIFRFGENIESGPEYKSPGFGDKALIERDREYAKSKAEEYHRKLVDKEITPHTALTEIQADPRLGYMNTAGSNRSANFGLDGIPLIRTVYHKTVVDYIKSQKSHGISPVQTGKTALVEEPTGDADYAETYYYFVYMENVGKTAEEFTKSIEEANLKITKNSEIRK